MMAVPRADIRTSPEPRHDGPHTGALLSPLWPGRGPPLDGGHRAAYGESLLQRLWEVSALVTQTSAPTEGAPHGH